MKDSEALELVLELATERLTKFSRKEKKKEWEAVKEVKRMIGAKKSREAEYRPTRGSGYCRTGPSGSPLLDPRVGTGKPISPTAPGGPLIRY